MNCQPAAMLVQNLAGAGDSCGTSDPSASCYVSTGVELVTAVVLVIRQLSAMLVQEGAGAGVTAVVLVSIAGHNRRWIDGSIPIVSIDTFGLIFIDFIDPSVKDFLFLIDSIDN
jgi:hypothetical protein